MCSDLSDTNHNPGADAARDGDDHPPCERGGRNDPLPLKEPVRDTTALPSEKNPPLDVSTSDAADKEPRSRPEATRPLLDDEAWEIERLTWLEHRDSRAKSNPKSVSSSKPLAAVRQRLESILSLAERKYGVTRIIGGGASLEQCLFLILRRGWDFKKASKAIRILESHYIDWNELRVSTIGEIFELIAPLKCSDLEDRVRRMKTFLQTVVDEYNDLNNDLFRLMEFELLRRFLVGVEILGKANAYVFLQCYRNELAKKNEDEADPAKLLIISPESMRVGIRLGIIKKTQSTNVARQDFWRIMGPSDDYRFQNVLVQHAETFCFPKNPHCKDCFLKDDCQYFKERT